MIQERQFPILISHRGTKGPCPTSIPWIAIAHCEAQAKINHQQSIENLASRGGLSPIEAYFVMTGRNWNNFVLTDEIEREAGAFLTKIVQDREALKAAHDRYQAVLQKILFVRAVGDSAEEAMSKVESWVAEVLTSPVDPCRCPNYISVVDGKCGACGKLVPNA